jgi:DNA invertase Pin-like site-specific DNA recombinase
LWCVLTISRGEPSFTAQVVAAVAELDRAMIVQRTNDGLDAARANGVRLSRERKTPDEAIRIAADLREHGASLQAIADRLNARGIKTATGRAWTFSSVRRALAYADRLEPIA